MNLLSDIITYVRRIVKTSSNQSLSDNLIIDYIDRFYLSDVDARVQLFDFKTRYIFQTIPGISDYNIPLYSPQEQPGGQVISPFPVYQGFFGPLLVNGIEANLFTQRETFQNMYPNYVQSLAQVATGDGTTTRFTFNLPYFPAIPGHIDITGIIALYNRTLTVQDPPFSSVMAVADSSNTWVVPTSSVLPRVTINYIGTDGNNVTIIDSGQFLDGDTGGQLYGLLVYNTNTFPNGLQTLAGGYSVTSNTVNYETGLVNVNFPVPPLAGTPIQVQCLFYQQGLVRSALFYNNVLTLRPPNNTQYQIEVGAYLTPAAFLNTAGAIPFGYMAEYLARGAARKILSDTGDWDQFDRYEPLFLEQERLVWKRSQRIFTSTRTPTIYSNTLWGQNPANNFNGGYT